MGNPQTKSYEKLILVTVGVAAFVSLAWSAGLIGKGIWQLSQSKIPTESNGKNIANFSHVPNVATGVFNYGGSTAWASLRLAVDSVIQSERPEIQFRYVQPQNQPPGSSPGIGMLLEGKVDFVQSSRSLRPEEYQLAKQKGLKLKQIPVAVDSIVVAVHPKLDIPGLTLSQLQAIYRGEITNWQEVGGADLPITAYSRPASTGEIVDFIALKTGQNRANREMGSNIKFVPTATQALRQLANNPGGIYYDSTATIMPQCTVKPLPISEKGNNLVAPYQPPLVPASACPKKRNQPNVKAIRSAQYPLTHYLYVVFLENNDGKEQIGQVYANFLLTPQGQKLISKTGFLALD
ncbi:MAG: solute-binding protein [Pleurocapsa sp. SU_5_0]|nr:solute-binding protein [Pleurocapsa sp. SU_5_0]